MTHTHVSDGLKAATLLVFAACLAPVAAQTFPAGFKWGTGISGFQTEMGASPSSRDTNSDWWVWVTNPANISSGVVTGQTPDTGPGFFDSYASDLNTARQLGSGAIRMSFEWSRIFPTSTAAVDISSGITLAKLMDLDRLANPAAVDRYRRILLAARQQGVEPYITLNHFTLPLWLHEPMAVKAAFQGISPTSLTMPAGLQKKGWLDPATIAEFAKYSAYCAWKFGDLVDQWITLNEPMVVSGRGYLGGNHPPGVFHFRAAMTATAYLVEAHARGYDIIKALDTLDADGDGVRASVGVAHNFSAFEPADASSADDARGTAHATWFFNKLFLHAVSRGEFDFDFDGLIEPGETRSNLANRLDFVGVNYYTRTKIKGLAQPISMLMPVIDFQSTTSYRSALFPNGPACPTTCTDVGWEIYPQGLTDVLTIAGSYGRPVYITESGVSASSEAVRVNYLTQHIGQVRQAMTAGLADVRGYFVWSLIDNFEWNSGYLPKFGLLYFDPVTKARQVRISGWYYRSIALRNGL